MLLLSTGASCWLCTVFALQQSLGHCCSATTTTNNDSPSRQWRNEREKSENPLRSLACLSSSCNWGEILQHSSSSSESFVRCCYRVDMKHMCDMWKRWTIPKSKSELEFYAHPFVYLSSLLPFHRADMLFIRRRCRFFFVREMFIHFAPVWKYVKIVLYRERKEIKG